MNVFVSYAHQDRGLAEQLIKALQAHGIVAFSAAESLVAGADWQRDIEQSATSSDAIIFMIDSRHEPGPYQQYEWSASLEAEWENPDKRLVPILIGDAKIPSFTIQQTGPQSA